MPWVKLWKEREGVIAIGDEAVDDVKSCWSSAEALLELNFRKRVAFRFLSESVLLMGGVLLCLLKLILRTSFEVLGFRFLPPALMVVFSKGVARMLILSPPDKTN